MCDQSGMPAGDSTSAGVHVLSARLGDSPDLAGGQLPSLMICGGDVPDHVTAAFSPLLPPSPFQRHRAGPVAVVAEELHAPQS